MKKDKIALEFITVYKRYKDKSSDRRLKTGDVGKRLLIQNKNKKEQAG